MPTEHFTWDEVGHPPVELRPRAKALARWLELIREAVGSPIKVNSWYRPLASETSLHRTAEAVDFVVVRGFYAGNHKALSELIESLIRLAIIPDGGLGTYDAHVHYDIGRAGRRWTGESR